MEYKEIKIKSYQYMLQNLLCLFAVGTLLLLMICIVVIGYDNRSIVFISYMISISCLWLIGALITRLGCRTYDIYNKDGIKRVRGNKIIFDVKWENVETALYFGLSNIIILCPFILKIDLKEPLVTNENRSYDNEIKITTPMSKKTLRRIEEIVPFEIMYMPKRLKHSKQK